MNEKCLAFVTAVISWQQQPGKAAKMKRADNPATEYMSWELVCPWCGDEFQKESKRLPYETIGAAVARAKIETNGTLPFGRALACCADSKVEDKTKDPMTAHLRRLLGCETVQEVCMVIRPVLSLLASKGVNFDYAGLLEDLLYFGDSKKRKWASDYYWKGGSDDAGNANQLEH